MAKSIICDGIKYKSKTEFARSLGITRKGINYQLYISKFTPEEIKKYHTKKTYHIFDDKLTALFLFGRGRKLKGITYIDTNKLNMVLNVSRIWTKNLGGYACHHSTNNFISLHRLLLGINNPEIQVDHIDGDPMNNQIKNLRIATCGENIRNSRKRKNNKSGLKGIWFNKEKNKWDASICVNRNALWLGRFDNKIEAARAYDEAARKLHGEFARTNEMLGLLK